MFSLEGRVAVISGASSGLGKQMARAFAKQGAKLVVLARRIERLAGITFMAYHLLMKIPSYGHATRSSVPSA